MSNPDDLTKALAQNGSYDARKAEKQKEEMVDTFKATTRKVERVLCGRGLLYACLGVFAGAHFMQSSSTKALLFYGFLALVFLICLLHAKTWYLVAITKVAVLKAICRLELRGAAGQGNRPPEDAEVELPFVDGLPQWERRLWWWGIIAACFLVLFVKGLDVQGVEDPWDLTGGGNLTSDACLTLEADGSSVEVAEMSFVSEGTVPRRGFHFHAPETAQLAFTDAEGREMSFTTSGKEGRVRHDVRLPNPVMSGRRFGYTRTQQSPDSATEEDGLWTCSGDISYGHDTNELSQAVVLPEGAEIVSVRPWPAATFTLGERATVRFEATRASNAAFEYTVEYRLPPRSPAE